MNDFRSLQGTAVALVAHPDDEVIAFGALFQQMKKAIVVFATDGAPRDPHFWERYGSRKGYAKIRRQEACVALNIIGAHPIFMWERVKGGIADQELFKRLPVAVRAFEQILVENTPDCVLTLAYEGGHPDHDAACFIASDVGKRLKLPVWESPLYHRRTDGSIATQTFPATTGNEIELKVEDPALEKKLQMFHTYKSQSLALGSFHPEIEKLRPVMAYDFTIPPMPWKLNYELWQWKMTGEEVAASFASYLRSAHSRGA
ncbi:MAG TPA: PIG-L family deacetylase [Candidatus Angelobacter sp.]|jgi:LmbE family N-acetylglucosaminyl deacetylase|nr:PIG-L family deacetylase [Candidatus Angelobacter sp.]